MSADPTPEAVHPLSAAEEASIRHEADTRPVGDISWTTHTVRRLLATIDAAGHTWAEHVDCVVADCTVAYLARRDAPDPDALREAIESLDDHADTYRVWRAMSAQRLAEVLADALAAGVQPVPADYAALREATVVAMESEGVVTWGDPGHRARFLLAAGIQPVPSEPEEATNG